MTHTVKQGEHLSGLAKKYGFGDYRILWDHPENAALKSKRKNPHVLYPGDSLFIPDKQEKKEACATTKRHRFQVRLPKLMLRIVVKDVDNLPITNTPCELEVEGAVYQLTTDAKGKIETEVPATAESGNLRIPSLDIEVPVKIGHLDPEDEDSGWQARLVNLGYHVDPLDQGEVAQLRLQYAIEEFQHDHKLKVTGILDAATKAKLKEAHGC